MTDRENHDRTPSVDRRMDLIEGDMRDHAKTLTEIINRLNAGFSQEQIGQIHQAMREELSEAGLRLDSPNLKDEAREDFRFLRRLRMSYDGAAKKVGGAVLTAIILLAISIFGAGFWAWLARGGR